jgi:hypothetical protein
MLPRLVHLLLLLLPLLLLLLLQPLSQWRCRLLNRPPCCQLVPVPGLLPQLLIQPARGWGELRPLHMLLLEPTVMQGSLLMQPQGHWRVLAGLLLLLLWWQLLHDTPVKAAVSCCIQGLVSVRCPDTCCIIGQPCAMCSRCGPSPWSCAAPAGASCCNGCIQLLQQRLGYLCTPFSPWGTSITCCCAQACCCCREAYTGKVRHSTIHTRIKPVSVSLSPLATTTAGSSSGSSSSSSTQLLQHAQLSTCTATPQCC